MAILRKLTQPEKDLCKIITPEFRVSYPHVFKPMQLKPTDKAKYSITMLFPKNVELLGIIPPGCEGAGTPRLLNDVIKNAKRAQWPDGKYPANLASPVIDGDDPRFADKDGYKGHWVIKATTNEEQQPQVVDATMVKIQNAGEFYPGCYARAAVFAYAWEYMGKTGIGFILDHVQKLRDGKPFGGKKSAENTFGPLSAAPTSASVDSEADMDFK